MARRPGILRPEPLEGRILLAHFSAPLSYGVGSLPVSLAVGDFNDDGKLDLATPNSNGNSVSILIGNGDGTFQTSRDVAVGSAPSSVASADFNGDGKADLAVTNAASNTVSILLGDGNGSFQAPVSLATPGSPNSVVAIDLNHDGKADLVVANAGSIATSVLLGNGDGSFQPPVNYVTGTSFAAAAGDFNGDSSPDIALAHFSTNAMPDGSMSILRGNGDGTFQASAESGAGTNPVGVVTGDLNHDGVSDVAVVNLNSANVSVFLSRGDGTFQNAVNYSVGTKPFGLAAVDLNGDGKLDLAVVDRLSNDVEVLTGNGDGTFQTAASFAAGSLPDSIVAGDFNHDGLMDLAVASQANNKVSILLQQTNASPVASPGPDQSVQEGDLVSFDGRGSYDADGTIANILWDFGDGAAATGATASHAYADSGDYTVTLIVTDNEGASTSATQVVHVANVAPTATLSTSAPVTDGSSAVLTFSNPFDPSSADTQAGFRYAFDFGNKGTWDVGDGTYAGSSSISSASLPERPAGPFTVRGRIIDKDGGYTDYVTTFTVSDDDPASPVIVLGGSSGTLPDNRTQFFTWNISAPSGLSALEISITQDGGNGPQEIYHTTDLASAVGSFNFDTYGLGTFQITVTATDADNDFAGDASTGSASQSTIVIRDTPDPPAISLGGSSGTEVDGQTQSFFWTAQGANSVGTVGPLGALQVSVTQDTGSGPHEIFHTTDLSQAIGSFHFDSYGPGTFNLTVSAANADDDFPGDALTAIATRTVNVIAPHGIVWLNRGDPSDNFDAVFGPNAAEARAVVDSAISDWNTLIPSYNRADGTTGFAAVIRMDPSDLSLLGLDAASNQDLDAAGVPVAGQISFGSGTDGHGSGWYLDPTPNDSAEFSTSVVNAFAADAGANIRDFYSTVLHELGHSLGIFGTYFQAAAQEGRIGFADTGQTWTTSNDTLYTFTGPSVDALLFSGASHIAWPGITYTDPATGIVYQGTDDLLNEGRTNGLRRLPSNLDLMMLKDAFGYSVVMPETLGTFYAVLDPATGNLLVRGQSGLVDNAIRLTEAGGQMVVSVTPGIVPPGMVRPPGVDPAAPYVSSFPVGSIRSITILGARGNDSITLDGWSAPLTIDGQGGSDTYVINLGNGNGPVTISDSGPTTDADQLVVNGTPGDDSIVKTATQVTWGSPVAETVSYSGVENLTINGGAGNDTIVDPGGNTTINGGPGNDTIVITGTTGSGVSLDGGDGSDTYIVDLGSLLGPVSIGDTGTTGGDAVSVMGTPGVDNVVLATGQVTSGAQIISIASPIASLAIDGGGGNDQITVQSPPAPRLTVAHFAPLVGNIAGPLAPTLVSTAISAGAGFTDYDRDETHAATWNWGDGTTSAGSVAETSGSGSVSGSHVYNAAGVYTVTLTVTDSRGKSSRSLFNYVVVYDPSAGFVTGGGWVASPPGAYAANPALTGKASFGFVSRYLKGASVPSGYTQFQFQAAGFNFQGTSDDWLVISGSKAQYKGSGTVNGAGDDGFLLTATDGEAAGGGGVDRFRLKVWNKVTGAVIYDNQMGAADTAGTTTAIGGGDIVIHAGSNALKVAGGPAAGGTSSAPLTPRTLAPLVDEALALWHTAGVSKARLAALGHPTVRVVDLPGSDLGLASAGTIWIDRDAAGYGWFVDPTPGDNTEFGPKVAAAARGRIDLLTVLDHEIGHLLGLDHRATGLMAKTLAPGVRKLPAASSFHRVASAPPVTSSGRSSVKVLQG